MANGMAKASVWGKAQRVLRFLLALSNPRIAAAMVRHGFSGADLDEGWTLLRALRPVRLDAVPPPEPGRAPLEGLFAWEHEWIPIARATLRRHFPTLHKRLFVQTFPNEGLSKILFVDAFLKTLDRLERTAEGRKASALIERRGLSREVLAGGRALVDAIQRGTPTPDGGPSDDRSDWVARETALWGWYLEWGSILQGHQVRR